MFLPFIKMVRRAQRVQQESRCNASSAQVGHRCLVAGKGDKRFALIRIIKESKRS